MDLGCLLLSPKLRVLHSWKSIRFHKRKGTALKVFLCWLSRWLGSIYRSAEHQCISRVSLWIKGAARFCTECFGQMLVQCGVHWMVCSVQSSATVLYCMVRTVEKSKMAIGLQTIFHPKLFSDDFKLKSIFLLACSRAQNEYGEISVLMSGCGLLLLPLPPSPQLANLKKDPVMWDPKIFETMSMHIHLVLALGGGGIYLY